MASDSDNGAARGRAAAAWSLLSNHAHVLVCLARDPDSRLRDVAERVGMTERGVVRIVAELEHAGIIRRIRTGRRNHYQFDLGVRLRHPLESDRTVGELLSSLVDAPVARRLGLQAGVDGTALRS